MIDPFRKLRNKVGGDVKSDLEKQPEKFGKFKLKVHSC